MDAELVHPEGLVENTHSGTPLCFFNSRPTPALSNAGAPELLTFKKEHLDFSLWEVRGNVSDFLLSGGWGELKPFSG